jgi:hypothetical protein
MIRNQNMEQIQNFVQEIPFFKFGQVQVRWNNSKII